MVRTLFGASTIFLVLITGSQAKFSYHRIVGGQPASVGEFPWQVELVDQGDHWCGGSILRSQWILTAAHCLYNVNINNIQIWAGFVNRNNPGNSVQKAQISQTILHPNYIEGLDENDIALIKLSTSLSLNSNVAAIALPSSTNYVPSGSALASGWGSLQENSPPSDTLYKVEVPVMTWNECAQFYGEEFDKTLLCAGYKEGGKDACQGDSGGPLACSGSGNQKILCGIIATGLGCARKNYPGIYTSTAPFLNWISISMR